MLVIPEFLAIRHAGRRPAGDHLVGHHELRSSVSPCLIRVIGVPLELIRVPRFRYFITRPAYRFSTCSLDGRGPLHMRA
jgi:hypothetical protein